MIGVIYPDKYAVKETFQLMKIPWEWYDPSEGYDVVIGRKEDLSGEQLNKDVIWIDEVGLVRVMVEEIIKGGLI